MATFDYSFGSAPGVQMQGGAHTGVNSFELDFADAKKAFPALAPADILTIGILKKGMLVSPGLVETLEASQAGASDLVIQTDGAVVITSGHGIDTQGEISLPSVAAGAFFGQTTSTPKLLTADVKVNVLIGATLPTKGKLRAAFAVDQLANY